MSLKAMAYVWEIDLPSAQKLMLLAIADRCDDEGTCFPGVSRIAYKCNVTERNASKTLAKLEKLGELTIILNQGVQTGSGCTNRYYMKAYRTSIGLSTPERGKRVDQMIETGWQPPTPPVKTDSPLTPVDNDRGDLSKPTAPRPVDNDRGDLSKPTENPSENPSVNTLDKTSDSVDRPDIFRLYEAFGQTDPNFAKTKDVINGWFEEYGKHKPQQALEIAAGRHSRGEVNVKAPLAYIGKILANWEREGYNAAAPDKPSKSDEPAYLKDYPYMRESKKPTVIDETTRAAIDAFKNGE